VQRDQLRLAVDVGEAQRRGPGHGPQRDLEGALERLRERAQLTHGRGAVEAADAEVDRVHLPAADRRDEAVAHLLERERLLDDLAVVTRHLDHAAVAEEVGRVQHVDVERVALDPFAAIDQPPQVADRALVDRHPACVLHRPYGAHLIGDRADAADSRGDVGGLGERAAAKQRLEEARRLVDAQLDVDDLAPVELDVHRALALDAREVIRSDRALSRHARAPRSPRGTRERPR